MDTKKTLEFNRMLLNRKSELTRLKERNRRDQSEFLENGNPLGEDTADQAVYLTERDSLVRRGVGVATEMRAIDEALSRIASGHYGECVRCQEEITEARLKAVLWTLLCLSCQKEAEREVTRLSREVLIP